MVKELIEAFFAGVLSYIIFTLVGSFLLSKLPQLPFGLMAALIFGILVLIVDFIFRETIKF